MLKKIHQAAVFLALIMTIIGAISSSIWLVNQATDSKPPFGRYSLAIESGTSVQPGGQYWAKWSVERLRNDCKIGFTTVLFDSDEKEFVLARQELGPPAKNDIHPGEVRSYARKYTVPEDASFGPANMTAKIVWVCNDIRHAMGLIGYGHYNLAELNVVEPLQ